MTTTNAKEESFHMNLSPKLLHTYLDLVSANQLHNIFAAKNVARRQITFAANMAARLKEKIYRQ